MSFRSAVTAATPAKARNVAVHRHLYTPPLLRNSTRPIALVYGNCQAEALRRVLAAHAGFSAEYSMLRVPAVHEITSRQARLVRSRMSEVEVFITQDIRDGYRDLAIGSQELAAGLTAGARVVRYPVAFYRGLHPFLVYVYDGGPLAVSAPIIDYHDVRILYAAGRGWSTDDTLGWLASLHIDADWVRETARRSLVELRRREAGMPVQLADVIADHAHQGRSFWTINHPTNNLVREMARQVLMHLDYDEHDAVLCAQQTYLDHLAAPREAEVLRALGVATAGQDGEDWVVRGRRVPRREIVEAHLNFYTRQPSLLENGLARHARLFSQLGLPALA